MIKLSINFSWFCPETVGQICVVFINTFSRFCEGKISRKKCVSSELWVQRLCPMLSKTRITCAVFFGAKARSGKLLWISRKKSPVGVVKGAVEMSKKFCRIKFLLVSKTFFLELWPLIWQSVLSKLHSRCPPEQFVEKNLSSKNWVEKDRTMLSKLLFTSVENRFWGKFSHSFEETFFGWWTNVISTCVSWGTFARKLSKKF